MEGLSFINPKLVEQSWIYERLSIGLLLCAVICFLLVLNITIACERWRLSRSSRESKQTRTISRNDLINDAASRPPTTNDSSFSVDYSDCRTDECPQISTNCSESSVSSDNLSSSQSSHDSLQGAQKSQQFSKYWTVKTNAGMIVSKSPVSFTPYRAGLRTTKWYLHGGEGLDIYDKLPYDPQLNEEQLKAFLGVPILLKSIKETTDLRGTLSHDHPVARNLAKIAIAATGVGIGAFILNRMNKL